MSAPDFAIDTGRKWTGDTGYLYSYTVTTHGNRAGSTLAFKIGNFAEDDAIKNEGELLMGSFSAEISLSEMVTLEKTE